MENRERDQIARVWQRVQGGSGDGESGLELQYLMEALWEDARLYRQISRRRKGRKAAIAMQLHRQAAAHLKILKGVCALQDRCHPVFSTAAPGKEPEIVSLRRCYGHAAQRLGWYTTREQDPQCGHIFAQLAREEQASSRLLLQLMQGASQKN